jgi:hypothetical protein
MSEQLTSRFFAVAIATFVAVLAVAACVNFVVDPYALFHDWSIHGLTQSKPAAGNRAYLIKPTLVRRMRANTIVLGASREDVGMDPAIAEWPAEYRSVFNFGVPGARPYMQLRYLQHAAAAHHPKLVVAGLDYLSFLEPAQPGAPLTVTPEETRLLVRFDGSPTPGVGRQVVYDQFAALSSFDALVDSVRTLVGQTGYTSVTSQGFSSGAERFSSEIRAKGQYSVFADMVRAQARILRRLSGVRSPAATTERQVRALQALLAFAIASGSELKLFIDPSHVYELENIRAYGRWQDYERWKYDLVLAVTAANASAHNGAAISLVDFSGYHDIATEELPRPGDTATTMRWYWDPIHFHKALGDLIIRDLVSKQPALGVPLRMDTICAHLAGERRRMNQYLALRAHSQELYLTITGSLHRANVEPLPPMESRCVASGAGPGNAGPTAAARQRP